MDYLKKNRKTSQLEYETIAKFEKLAKTKNELTLESLINKMNLNATKDEKFILMLISMIHKKCSSELLLALLYIVS